MRNLISSLGLVMFLALSNHAFGQFNSKEYLLTIGDLVTKKGLSDHTAMNPLQKLYLCSSPSARLLMERSRHHDSSERRHRD